MSSAITTPQFGPSAGYVQQPRFQLLLNGVAAKYPLSATVTTNNYSEPSTFEATIILDPNDPIGVTEDASVSVEITATLQGGNPTTLIYGLVDNVEVDAIVGTATFSGRDLAGRLVDTPTEDTFGNYTPSQVVEKFVADHAASGLQGDITAVKGSVGRFYGIDYAFTIFGQLYRATNQWDMVLFLAQMVGFEARITGKTLYFGPPTAETSKPFIVAVNGLPASAANVENLHLARSLTLAKDVQVTVLSWNSYLVRPIKRVVKSVNQKAPKGGFGPTQNYVFYKPDLTPDQALQYGLAKLKDITKRERVVSFELPFELTLQNDSIVKLQGTGSDWDQVYYIDQIEREISFASGATQSVRVKNLSPANQEVVQ